MQRHYACGSPEHRIARRSFLGSLAAGAGVVGGLQWLTQPAAARQLSADQKRILVIYMYGGLSQLESWDPKPGTATGGPFDAIPTSVPGLHVSELLPSTSLQMHRLAVVRGVNTKENGHGPGYYLITTGRREQEPGDYPHLGAVAAKALGGDDGGLPGHIKIRPRGLRPNDFAYLGPRYAGLVLKEGAPDNTTLPDPVSSEADLRRQDFRRSLNDRFQQRRRTAETDAYTFSYEQALDLMARREVFDVTREPERDQSRYGRHDFGRHCLLARRLLENGATFVQVTHGNYDTHNENFDFHQQLLAEFDHPFATLIEDLDERGMLESTLVVVLSEFGRTPKINPRYGRDHFGTAWSVVLGGARIHRGAVVGKTNDLGTQVVDREVNQADLFHTYLQAVGLDSHEPFNLGGRQMPMADPAHHAIEELLT
jgi:hypothetical protein